MGMGFVFGFVKDVDLLCVEVGWRRVGGGVVFLGILGEVWVYVI